MSMICNLCRVSPEELDRLLAAPAHVMTFLYGEDVAALATPPRNFLLRVLSAFRRPPPPPPVPWAPRRDGDEIDLEKAWHGLQFLFTGTAWEGDEPACYLVRGGLEVGKVDVGYGPARALRPRRGFGHRVSPGALHDAA